MKESLTYKNGTEIEKLSDQKQEMVPERMSMKGEKHTLKKVRTKVSSFTSLHCLNMRTSGVDIPHDLLEA